MQNINRNQKGRLQKAYVGLTESIGSGSAESFGDRLIDWLLSQSSENLSEVNTVVGYVKVLFPKQHSRFCHLRTLVEKPYTQGFLDAWLRKDRSSMAPSCCFCYQLVAASDTTRQNKNNRIFHRHCGEQAKLVLQTAFINIRAVLEAALSPVSVPVRSARQSMNI